MLAQFYRRGLAKFAKQKTGKFKGAAEHRFVGISGVTGPETCLERRTNCWLITAYAYKAKLDAANTQDRMAAELAGKTIEAKMEAQKRASAVMIGEQGAATPPLSGRCSRCP
jgi:hypothetical protein